MASNSRDNQEERMRELLEEKVEAARARAENERLIGHDRPAGNPDPRAKSSGHKQKTADKWNQ
jgi:hypothetical protein